MSNPLETQVGGDHYKHQAIQPIEAIVILGWDFVQGSIFKYLTRYKYKNGLEDLQKALHYAQLGTSIYNGSILATTPSRYAFIKCYCRITSRADGFDTIMMGINERKFQSVALLIQVLINQEYPA